MRKKNNLSMTEGDYPYSQFAVSSSQSRLRDLPSDLVTSKIVPNCINDFDRISSVKPEMGQQGAYYIRDRLQYKSGLQMHRLNDTIEELAQRVRKKDNYRYKQNTIVDDTINLDQTLPSIANTTLRKDSTKLMDEIKRVEHKIKAMKNEREEINQQRRQHENLRPFVDMHNQSMMYMQMMLMAQGNKQHKCCHKCHHNTQQPQPPQYVLPYQPMQGYPVQYPPPHQANRSSDLSQGKNTKKRAFQKPLKKYNFSKLRKFRAAVIAVYFQLLLPKYANRFTLRRYRAHTNYFNNVNMLGLRKDIQKELREKVIKWNMIQITQIVSRARADKEVRRVKQTKTAKLIISQQYNGNENYEFYLGDVELFLFQFLKKMKEAVQYDDDLQNILRFAAHGNMPFSFPVDHYYLLDELYSLKFHPQRLYLQNNRKIAKAMLLSSIFVKLITYSLFFPIKQNQEWKVRMLKANNMKKQNMIQAEMAAVQMHLSGILLHRYSMQLIQEALKETSSNILDISPQSWPIPQNALVFQGSDDVETAFSAAAAKKVKSRAQRISLNKDPVNLQGYKEFNIYDFTYVKNLADFQKLLQQINKASRYEEHVKAIIVEIIDTIYQKLMAHRKEEYKRIKDELLIEEKSLLSVKVNYSLLALGKRSGPQRKIIKEAIQLVKLNRQKQQNPSQQEQQGQGEQQQSKQSK